MSLATLATKKRRSDLEEKLENIDEAIAKFSVKREIWIKLNDDDEDGYQGYQEEEDEEAERKRQEEKKRAEEARLLSLKYSGKGR